MPPPGMAPPPRSLTPPPWFCGQTNDLQLVREALRSLRNSFSGHDPQHHTIDSLEQGISSLMERLHRMEVQKRQERRVRGIPRPCGPGACPVRMRPEAPGGLL